MQFSLSHQVAIWLCKTNHNSERRRLSLRESHSQTMILVIDGQGGGIGRSLIEQLKKRLPDEQVVAVGTNSGAASAMLKAGADAGATGENAVIYNSKRADVIAGPVGILLANSMFGEVSPSMAAAVSESQAQKILIPIAKCNAVVVGTQTKPIVQYIEEAVQMIAEQIEGKI